MKAIDGVTPSMDARSLVLGTMDFGKSVDPARAEEIVGCFLDIGGTMLDTADCYAGGKGEEIIGALPSSYRSQFRVCTKTGRPFDSDPGGYSPQRIRSALHASLRRLRRDHVELYLLHQWEPETSIESAVQELENLRDEGLLVDYGLGNHPAHEIGRAHGAASVRGGVGPVAYQLHYSLACRDIENEIVPCAARAGASIMAWSPLSGGVLTGKYRHASSERQRRGDREAGRRGYGFEHATANPALPQVLNALESVAGRRDELPARIALSWLLQQPQISCAVLGAQTAEQLRELAEAPLPQLASAELALLDDASSMPATYPSDFIAMVLAERGYDRPRG